MKTLGKSFQLLGLGWGTPNNFAGGNDVTVQFCSNISTDLDCKDLYLTFRQYGMIERMKVRWKEERK